MAEDETETYEEETGESRRSFMKKGAVAAGGLALGAASADSAAAQQSRNVLVYSYQYYPGVRFRVIAPLQQSTTVRALRRPGGQTVPEISQPDDYNGYVITYRLSTGGDTDRAAGITTFAFTRQNLQTGRNYRIGVDATVFSSRLSLLSSQARLQGN
ncbi:twin-arginine translocation signal domain-containing protein [Halorussus halophilus]|uniref:twin-arginine translocation signal domain-containing protein n=1 Tax=Halorussus halophilus TaxID=2650975 RepID=UPI001CE4205E|nr:twin-arginine translocation signal domain-containing protein [Halorussus halophilus]